MVTSKNAQLLNMFISIINKQSNNSLPYMNKYIKRFPFIYFTDYFYLRNKYPYNKV